MHAPVGAYPQGQKWLSLENREEVCNLECERQLSPCPHCNVRGGLIKGAIASSAFSQSSHQGRCEKAPRGAKKLEQYRLHGGSRCCIVC